MSFTVRARIIIPRDKGGSKWQVQSSKSRQPRNRAPASPDGYAVAGGARPGPSTSLGTSKTGRGTQAHGPARQRRVNFVYDYAVAGPERGMDGPPSPLLCQGYAGLWRVFAALRQEEHLFWWTVLGGRATKISAECRVRSAE